MEDGVRVQFKPSTFVLKEKKWSIEDNGELVIRKNLLSANNVKISQGDFQEIRIVTEEEDGGNTSNLVVKLKNIVLGDITSLFMRKETLEGIVSGEIKVSDYFGDYQASANLKAASFYYEQDSIGVVDIKAAYDSKSGLLPFEVISPNKNYDLSAKGSYNIKDTSGNSFKTKIHLNETQISVIENLLTGLFSNLKGMASGDLEISGNLNAPQLLGAISLKDAGLMVDFTQVEYSIDSANLLFEEDGINFGSFTLRDKYGYTGTASGKLYENGFKDMAFDFDVRTDKLLMIDTKAKDNEQFYGKAIGRANLSFKGPENDCKMTIVAEANDSSHIYIPNKESKESGSADFIVFKSYGTELETSSKKSNFNLTVDLDVTANNKVMIDVILDEVSGDIIKAVGNGRLLIKAGTVEPLTIKGRYNIERGNYDFNFQSLLKKPFELLPNSNNYIEWNGDPYKATMSIDAQYTAERISLSDLIGNNIFSGSVRGYRGDVYVIAELRNQLSQPDISFRLDFPQGSPVKNDNEFSAFLNRIQRDENEILKQVSFLIVFGTFAPPGEFSSRSGGTNPYN
ncbi:translocation/assembly module TamB domain-containing protein, partial [Sediminibacterium salmoneum]|uniref:translocation/assembly module TamB domain-containing protein n=1 Tax=Sediminibacterium salmoneum TaxID=426421 RepID=UPI0005691B0B